MRILKVLFSSDKGGVLAYEIQFIQEFKKRGIQVDAVIIGEEAQGEEYKKICDRCYTVPNLDAQFIGSPVHIMNSLVKAYSFGAKYSKYLINNSIDPKAKYDAVFYCRPNVIHLAGLLARHFNCIGLWHLPNTVTRKLARSYYKYFCEKYNIVSVGNSAYTQATLGPQCKHVVYMGYDEDRVQPSAENFRSELGIAEGAPVYGIAARLHKAKAQDIVVEAFVNSDIPAKGGHLIVAGGPLNSEFAKKVQLSAKDLAGKQVHFLGNVSELPKFYSTLDVAVNGRRNVEPFGISVAEALGAGRPVVAYYLGGPSEMIQHGENGWLVKTPTVEDFRATFNESIGDMPKWRKMSASARACAHTYSVKENTDRLLDIVARQEILTH
ncbi:glycosyltransferase family 4 protein [Pontibacter sp. E15-1]|uniref:glycosyltransferase family 4 protein n=1 Tax=Pontibacter sp. E15-1 TaxID=2919918 RepID=UPI001F4F241C|nr:glycosyltransferase family 4 protein [Pontibacter sp. E15-1]MCJ8164429.1 glycosyltransferase family 4 protein [Pontibacter sp. E15-1]